LPLYRGILFNFGDGLFLGYFHSPMMEDMTAYVKKE